MLKQDNISEKMDEVFVLEDRSSPNILPAHLVFFL